MSNESYKPRLSKGRTLVYVGILAISLVLLYFFTIRGMRFFLVPSSSMAPTLVPPEYLLTLSEGEYDRGDIVVLKDPDLPGDYLVKRLIGLPGDTIRVYAGALFLNGGYVSEPYAAEPMEYTITEPYEVPPDSVFVLGDNRNESSDSHGWGNGTMGGVPIESIVGRVHYVYLPLDRARRVEQYPLTSIDAEALASQ